MAPLRNRILTGQSSGGDGFSRRDCAFVERGDGSSGRTRAAASRPSQGCAVSSGFRRGSDRQFGWNCATLVHRYWPGVMDGTGEAQGHRLECGVQSGWQARGDGVS